MSQLQDAEDLQSGLREKFNNITRSTNRRLSILDLPDELLMQVFGETEFWEYEVPFFPNNASGINDVKNIRLTCRRFNETSSHLLIHLPSVRLDHASLSRLEEVSRHPVIRKGVKAVRVILCLYDSNLASNPQEFARFNAETILNKLDAYTDMAMLASLSGMPHSEAKPAVARLRKIAESWSRWSMNQDSIAEEDSVNIALGIEAHEKYRSCFDEQQELLNSGTFQHQVAAAFARMPTAMALKVKDFDRWSRWRPPRLLDIATDENFINALMQPIPWDRASKSGIGPRPPVELLVQLPVALFKAGVFLTTIKIAISPPRQLAGFAPSDDDRQHLAAAVQKLEHFVFQLHYSDVQQFERSHPRELEELMDLRIYLATVFDTRTLQTIDVEFRREWDHGTTSEFSLLGILNLRRRPNLSSLRCQGAPMHMAELQKFLERWDSPLKEVHLEDTYLLSGTWARTLDILREHSQGWCSIQFASGAECALLSDDKVFEIFYSTVNGVNKATEYIQGQTAQNPLRESSEMEGAE